MSPRLHLAAPAALTALMLGGCLQTETAAPATPQDAFWQALSSHCGKAYKGALVSNDEADADMRGAEMVMHVRTCDKQTITVPFHIKQDGGEWNRSRTWVFTRTGGGLRLKHDHRHEDGESDAVTMYGGDTADAGTARQQSFPVDAESIAMFQREGLDASVTNIWSVEVDPVASAKGSFTYQLTRTKQGGAPQDRDFRVTFNFADPATPPPAPWGF